LFLDGDLDGGEDLLVSNGHLHDVNNRDVGNLSRSRPGQNLQNTKDKFLQFPKLESAKFVFRNQRDLTFEDTSATWDFNSTRIAPGLISVDYDADGDLDVLLNALEGPPLIYRNDSPAPRVAVRLMGQAPNTQAGPVLVGGGERPTTLEVRWPDGRISRVGVPTSGLEVGVNGSTATRQ